jgi:hypothetical protein
MGLVDTEHSHVSYHRDFKFKYDQELVVQSSDEFIKKIGGWRPNLDVAVCHSFGNLQLLNKTFTIWQVIVKNKIVPYMLNQHLKACPDNPLAHGTLNNHVMENFQTLEPWAVRENFYLQYQWLKTSSYVTKLDENSDVEINFDNFYGEKSEFLSEVIKINPAVSAEMVYDHFQKTQKPILDRIHKYQHVMQCMNRKIKFDLSGFDLLDQGIMSGILNDTYPGFEWQCPNENHWFNSTDKILEII